MANGRKWISDENSRGIPFKYCEKKHVNLTQLKEDFPDHPYLGKENIPYYPEYKFRAPKVCHVTNKSGLEGILKDGGFRGKDKFLWWSLSVTGDTVVKDENFSQCWQRLDQMPLLKKFATSPAFHLHKSRYGNFRFTFNLRELLNIYSKEYCNRTAPILRVFSTHLYKQEILYVILVHPRYMTCYSEYPRLPFNEKHLCGYRFGKLSWRCQSPSDKYEYCLEKNDGDMFAKLLRKPGYFVWDHVAVAFHMEQNWLLPVSRRGLFKNLSVCEIALPNLSNNPAMPLPKAEAEVEELRKKYLS